MATSDGRPETVYELCEMVCEAIELRPLNYIQQWWHADAKDWNEAACGTAYCRAGWMAALLRRSKGPCEDDDFIIKTAFNVLRSAGVPSSATDLLFQGGAIGAETPGRSTPGVGTPDYIATGIKGMRDFMSTYEQKLRHARINPDNTVTRMDGHPDGPQ